MLKIKLIVNFIKSGYSFIDHAYSEFYIERILLQVIIQVIVQLYTPARRWGRPPLGSSTQASARYCPLLGPPGGRAANQRT